MSGLRIDRIIASVALVALILVGMYFIGKMEARSNRVVASMSTPEVESSGAVTFQPVYTTDDDGTMIVYLGAKCPHDWHCKSISRVEVIDQDGVTLANITEDK